MRYFAAGVTLESTRLLDRYNIYELYKQLNKESLYIIGGEHTELNKEMIITPSCKNSEYEIINMFMKAVSNLPECFQMSFPDEFYVFEEKHTHLSDKLFVIKVEKLPKQEDSNITQNKSVLNKLKLWR